MVRLLGVGLLAAVALSTGSGSAAQGRLTKEAYLAALEHAIDGVTHGDWLSADPHLQAEIERFVRRLEGVKPPAEVAEIHAAWISSLRDCARELDGGRELKPCIDRHREICDRFYAKGYSFG